MKHIAKGLGVSRGRVIAPVCVIKSPQDFQNFREGMILVTHLTDPTMVPLMNKAAGIVCNIGGLTSHPSIVARELGIPCIVSAKCIETGKRITEILVDEQVISMCGETGDIYHIPEDTLISGWKLKW